MMGTYFTELPAKVAKIVANLNDVFDELDAAIYRVLHAGATAPASPVEGDRYYDTDDDKFFVYDGSGWREVYDTAAKHLFVPVRAPDTAHGNHYGKSLAAAGECHFEFQVPDKYSALGTVNLILIPTTTGTIDWTITTSAGDAGEDENANSDTATADGAAITDDELEPIDISGAFNGLSLAVGDYVGVKLVVDALTDTTAVNVLGIEFGYTPL